MKIAKGLTLAAALMLLGTVAPAQGSKVPVKSMAKVATTQSGKKETAKMEKKEEKMEAKMKKAEGKGMKKSGKRSKKNDSTKTKKPSL